MKITSVTVRKFDREGSNVKGFASVVLDDAFAIHDIRIIEGENGLFIAMKKKKKATGGFSDICHPLNSDIRKLFQDAILEEYDKVESAPAVEE